CSSDLLRQPRGRRGGGHPYIVAHSVPAHCQGLLPDLRELLRRHPLLHAEPDRGHRHGTARPAQRRLADADGTAGRQDRDRFRYGAPAVHAAVRAPLARLTLPAKSLPRSILFMCRMNAVRSPMAEAIARSMLGPGIFIASAGIRPGARDPFVDATLAEKGLTAPPH